MGGSSSKSQKAAPEHKKSTDDAVWLKKPPFIEIAGKHEAEITLEVDRSCFARIILTRDGTKERILIDVELKEGIPRKVGVDGLAPGSIYHLTFLYRKEPRRSAFPCCMRSNRMQRPPPKPQDQQQQQQQDYREFFETPEEQQRLRTAEKWVLRFIRQPGTFPRYYELRTLPENWASPSLSAKTPLTSFASRKTVK